MFYFEKKNQKTFGPLRAGLSRQRLSPREAGQMLLRAFFKKRFLLTSGLSRRADGLTMRAGGVDKACKSPLRPRATKANCEDDGCGNQNALHCVTPLKRHRHCLELKGRIAAVVLLDCDETIQAAAGGRKIRCRGVGVALGFSGVQRPRMENITGWKQTWRK
jgi:hypothetical protein